MRITPGTEGREDLRPRCGGVAMLGVGFGKSWPRALWERQVAWVWGGVPPGSDAPRRFRDLEGSPGGRNGLVLGGGSVEPWGIREKGHGRHPVPGRTLHLHPGGLAPAGRGWAGRRSLLPSSQLAGGEGL